MIATLLMALVTMLPTPTPKTPAHVELLPDSTVMVIWSDCSATIAPLDTVRWTSAGPRFEGPRTDIDSPTNDVLVTSYVDTRGLTRTIRTECSTMSQVDCVIQHEKVVKLMLASAPAKAAEASTPK